MTIEEELLDGTEREPKRPLVFTSDQYANLRAAMDIKRPVERLTEAERVRARWNRYRKVA